MKLFTSDWMSFNTVIELARKYNIGIEILEYADPNYFEKNVIPVDQIKNSAQGISSLSVHGPFSDLAPASRDQKVVGITRSRFQEAVNISNQIGAEHLVLHSGFIPKTYPRETWIEHTVKFWIDFLTNLQTQVRIHLENVYEDDFSILIQLIDTVNTELSRNALSICLDCGHVNANSSRSLFEWITRLGNRIQYVHLHNNYGVLDDHFGLLKGDIDYSVVLALLQDHSPDSIWSIETIIVDLEESIEWVLNYLDKS